MDNPAEKIRINSGKVSKEAGKTVTKLAGALPNGSAASIFLLGALWAAKQINKQPGFNLRSYEDGFKEALHPLTVQPKAMWTPLPEKAEKKAPAKAGAKS